MKELKYSRQRDAIKSALDNRTDHPTADKLYHELREDDPKISLGTVYRNLNLLSERGEILRITSADGNDHFDWNTAKHAHFICRTCGKVIDVPLEKIDTSSLSNDIGCPDSVVIYGTCSQCNNK